MSRLSSQTWRKISDVKSPRIPPAIATPPKGHEDCLSPIFDLSKPVSGWGFAKVEDGFLVDAATLTGVAIATGYRGPIGVESCCSICAPDCTPIGLCLFRRRYSHPVAQRSRVRFGRTEALTGFYSHQRCPDALRPIGYRDPFTFAQVEKDGAPWRRRVVAADPLNEIRAHHADICENVNREVTPQ